MKKILIAILIIPSLASADLRVIRKNRMLPIQCKESFEVVKWEIDSCFMYETYRGELTIAKTQKASHYCYEWALEKFQCKNFMIVIRN